jgi:hypothetical protein
LRFAINIILVGAIGVNFSKVSLSTLAIVAVLAGFSLSVCVSGLGQVTAQTSAQGSLTGINVGLYNDNGCTSNCTNLTWGAMTPGTPKPIGIFIKNTGALPETLSFATNGWAGTFNGQPVNDPTKANYFNLTWNIPSNTVLNPGDIQPVTFTLNINNTITGVDNFSFNIIVTGTQK